MKTFKDKILQSYDNGCGIPLYDCVTFDMFEEFSELLAKQEDTTYTELVHTLKVGHEIYDWEEVLDMGHDLTFKDFLNLFRRVGLQESDYYYIEQGMLRNFRIKELIPVIDALLAFQEPYGRIEVEFGLDVDEVKSACVSFLRSQGLDATQCIVDIFDLEFQLEEYVDIDEFMEYLRSKH